MERIRLIIADDHPLIIEGFCSVIKQNYRDIEVVAAVSSGREAVAEEARLKPDVMLMDIRMPDLDGIQAVCAIRRRNPLAKVVMLTTYDERELVEGALEAGAVGYILKDTPMAEVVLAIRAVSKGNVVFPQNLMELVDLAKRKRTSGDGANNDIEALQAHAELSSLSHREKEVLVLMARGMTNPQIADKLCIGDGTVRNYVHRIYDVLGVHNRTAVVLWAFEQGIR